MEINKTMHKPQGLEEQKRGNTYINMDNPDDELELMDGDDSSLMVIDNPDDYDIYDDE